MAVCAFVCLALGLLAYVYRLYEVCGDLSTIVAELALEAAQS